MYYALYIYIYICAYTCMIYDMRCDVVARLLHGGVSDDHLSCNRYHDVNIDAHGMGMYCCC